VKQAGGSCQTIDGLRSTDVVDALSDIDFKPRCAMMR